MRRPTSGDGVPCQVHQSKNGLEAHSTGLALRAVRYLTRAVSARDCWSHVIRAGDATPLYAAVPTPMSLVCLRDVAACTTGHARPGVSTYAIELGSPEAIPDSDLRVEDQSGNMKPEPAAHSCRRITLLIVGVRFRDRDHEMRVLGSRPHHVRSTLGRRCGRKPVQHGRIRNNQHQV